MTDRELLIAMLDRAGVAWEVEGRLDRPDIVVIEAQAGQKNEGYMGFVAKFHFAPNGALAKVGVWE